MHRVTQTLRRSSALLIVVAAIAAASLAYCSGLALQGGSGSPWAVAALATPAVANPNRAFARGGAWLNSQPLSAEDLRGKVVLVNFWTYSCINSLRPLPYVRAWADKYRDRGLVVIGVHTPEFGFEKDVANVRQATKDQGVGFPVILDSDYAVWRAFHNSAWPAFYFVGRDGQVRRQKLGEGGYDESERLIQQLLAEAGGPSVTDAIGPVEGVGAQAAPEWRDIQSGETYVGHEKATGFVTPGGLQRDVVTPYKAPEHLRLNNWGLSGVWRVGDEFATLAEPSGAIVFRFHARDLNLVMAPPPDGRAVRFRVRLDGAEPGADHGYDVDTQGQGELKRPRMYQLVRQARAIEDRTFAIEFLDAGARVYVFTFG